MSSFTPSNTTHTALPVLDMMMDMQRLGLQAMSAYNPFVFALRDAFERPTDGRRSELRKLRDTNEEQVIGVGEEILNVGTRMVPGKTTRIRRVVVQAPVQQDVTLHSETVVLERRRRL